MSHPSLVYPGRTHALPRLTWCMGSRPWLRELWRLWDGGLQEGARAMPAGVLHRPVCPVNMLSCGWYFFLN